MSKEGLIKARESQKPKFIYECFDYIIEEIPLNFRATIKCARNPKEEWRRIDRDYYVHNDDPREGNITDLKIIVEDVIKKYFLTGVAPIQPNHLKTSPRQGNALSNAL